MVSSTVHPRVHGELVSDGIISPAVTGSSPRTRGTLSLGLGEPRAIRFIPAYTGNSGLSSIPGKSRPVHPRVHGELVHSWQGAQIAFGSSPRTRGTRLNSGCPRGSRRFIPAYTGNSRPGSTSRPARTVHPRVHGELQLLPAVVDDSLGSSPRTRGTHQRRPDRGHDLRFIPAYTGNSDYASQLEQHLPVHPRVHGELVMSTRDEPPVCGSSPRTRGTRHLPDVAVLALRFIPAYTGNSRQSPSRSGRGSVHPRVHGELLILETTATSSHGSSPRTRGTPDYALLAYGTTRFIPAYTGNSTPGSALSPGTTVHPRVHGELLSDRPRPLPARGSSPRTRGTHRDGELREALRRFIPAYTGNSRPERRARPTGPVHPRVHGELGPPRGAGADLCGSSPRTRGTPLLHEHRTPRQRFIPAYTGNSTASRSLGSG